LKPLYINGFADLHFWLKWLEHIRGLYWPVCTKPVQFFWILFKREKIRQDSKKPVTYGMTTLEDILQNSFKKVLTNESQFANL
jgi:hypothetical protein